MVGCGFMPNFRLWRKTEVKLIQFETVDYSGGYKIEIRSVFAKQTIDFQKLVLLNEWIGILHADMILQMLAQNGISKDNRDLNSLTRSNCFFHAPKDFAPSRKKFPNATLQIGDGDHIAVKQVLHYLIL
jgi:anhydro-N-acetylmuramic acid kinase